MGGGGWVSAGSEGRAPPPQPRGAGWIPPSLPLSWQGRAREHAGTWNRNSARSTHPRDPSPGRAEPQQAPNYPGMRPTPGLRFPERGLMRNSQSSGSGESSGIRQTCLLSTCYVSGSKLGSANTVGTQTRPGFLGATWP